MPYISVIVPVYNAEKNMERCVGSVLKQGFSDWELLLIDDGSRDGSAALCDTFALQDARIRVFHKENGGVSSARNKGIDLAKGRYILFLDSDDYLPENYLEALTRQQEAWGEEAFCWTALRLISENHQVKEAVYAYGEDSCSIVRRSDVLKLSARYLLNAPWNKLYQSEIIRTHSLRMPEDISIAEDLWFNLQYLEAMGDCPIVILNQVTYFYIRNGEASLDHGYRSNYYKIHKKVLAELLDYSRKWQAPLEDESLYYARYWEYMQNAFSNLDLADCSLDGWQRFWEKGRILRDGKFQKSLTYQKKKMGRGSYLVMRSRSYLLVQLYHYLRQRSMHGKD
ncbi:MAG: glycosyltransferase family 2 protein [Lachnospiraceae bacterium]|nr:glycosyltransferase family 2 protein [Lachnospiraceae bacterium]